MSEVMVIDGGGRGEAIKQAMDRSPDVTRAEVFGNIQDGLDAFSGQSEKPFVVIGPEAPLVAGLADDLRTDGYTVLGAGKEASRYEASKSRATKMATRAGVHVPLTEYAEGPNMARIAERVIKYREPREYVIKADGLAGGKGVVLPDTVKEARDTVAGMMDGSLFDGAGQEVISFQSRHHGPEVSAMVVVGNGKEDFTILPLAQDHKRLLNDDQGPNTGGMGAYTQVPESIVSDEQYAKIEDMAYRSLEGMEAEGVRYEKAVLYIGMMMARDVERSKIGDPMLIEYNVRFGDPEIQAIMALLNRNEVDSYRLLRSAAEGSLELPDVDFKNLGGAALTVCLASPGYPDDPQKGFAIGGLNGYYGENVSVQLAGVKCDNGVYKTSGGRVLYVTATGESIDQAAADAYAAIGENGIHFPGMQYRTDIGWQVRQAA